MEVQEQKRLSIRLLGPPEVGFGEQPPLRFGVKKRLALLCYLAAEGGRHPRRELAELLGEESAPDEEGEEEARFFVIDGDLLGIEPKEVELDLEALEAAVSLARAEASLPGGRSTEDPAAVGRRDLI